ncbi:MAG: efflux RND transporter periplasmic adaptor subunit [Candidatus Wallbacteria bacterium]|nr:efflux RND transporter periplasmic adaptor subunit [Candidatus Wallbacteria bacterium]
MNQASNDPRSLVLQHAATLLVFAGLLGLGLLGHRTGWKLSGIPGPWTSEPAAAPDDWCETHGVPDSRCLACRPELGGADPKDWCKEHGVPESKDPLCHPELLAGKVAADWCGAHGVPESQCTLCNPSVAVVAKEPSSQRPAMITTGQSPAPNPLTCQTHQLRVQFASPEAVRKAGVATEPVVRRPMPATLEAPGQLDYDRTRLARLSSRLPGTVWKVLKQVGQPVKAGEVLALVDAAEVGRTKAALLQAVAQVDVKSKAFSRVREVAREGFRSQADFQEATAALREARIALFNAQQALVNLGLAIDLQAIEGLPESKLAEKVRLLGLPGEVLRALDPATATANLLPVAAPLDGLVVGREAVIGEVVDASRALFTVADVRHMWVELDVRLEDAAALALGQTVVFRPDAAGGEAVAGKLAWISTEADEVTRALKVRAEIANPQGRLRAHTFGVGRVVVRATPDAVAVPETALHWEGCCNVLFVQVSPELFQTRKVRLGARSAGHVEVLVGVLPGERVATTGSHVLKSEILKSQMGAGCVDD